MTNKDRALKSKSFCAALWTSIYQSPNGDVAPCCVWDGTTPIGNVNNTSLHELYKSDKILELKEKMLSGERLNECRYCNKLEDDIPGDDGSRTFFNENFFESIDWDSSDTKFLYWDLRISNLCNFKCRMCFHDLSSEWYDDAVKLLNDSNDIHKRELPENRIIKINDKSKFWNELESHYDYVESIYFAGGEPFLNEHHYKILQDLGDRKLYDTKIIVNTNASINKWKRKNILEYYRNFNHIVFGFSIDGSYEVGEYIRSGLEYEQWKKNVKEFVDFVKERNTYDITYLFQFAYGVTNFHNICDFIWDLFESGLIDDRYCKFNFMPIMNPIEQSVISLPPVVFDKFKKDFNNILDIFKNRNMSDDFIFSLNHAFKGIISFVESNPFEKSHLNTFYNRQIKLDKIRGENIFDILPDYRKLTISSNGQKLI